MNHPRLREDIRELLKSCPDMERAVSRLSLGRGGPRDLANIKTTLSVIPKIKNILSDFNSGAGASVEHELPASVSAIIGRLGFHENLVETLDKALDEELPLLARDGGFIRPGYYPPLDAVKELKEDSHKLILELQNKYAEAVNIPNLKIKYNNVIGYFIEVQSKFATEMLENKDFIHRQSVLNAARFTTVELTELENGIRGAAEKSLAMELELFDNMVRDIIAVSDDISRTAKALGELDVGAALADLAVENGYCRPQLDNSLAFEIVEGRHPVVEYAIKKSMAALLSAMTAFSTKTTLSGCSPDRIWPVSQPSFVRMRLLPLWRRWVLSYPASRRISALSIKSFPASAPVTIWRAAVPLLWWKWLKPPVF